MVQVAQVPMVPVAVVDLVVDLVAGHLLPLLMLVLRPSALGAWQTHRLLQAPSLAARGSKEGVRLCKWMFFAE